MTVLLLTISTHLLKTSSKSPRFVFFLYYYPPEFGSAPKRNLLISSELVKHAEYAEVFTAAGENQFEPDVENMYVIPIKAFDYRSFLRKRTTDGALPEEQKQSKMMQYLIKLINTFPVNIMLGEGGIFYYLSLVRKGYRSIKTNKITHLYSSFRPFADHYAAYILKKRHPHIVWIADFRDLIIDPHYRHILYQDSQQAFFKRIFKRADVITTVSDGLANHLKEYNNNVITLRNGIKKIPQQINPVHCKYFKIAYTGSMFLDKRNAEPLFKGLSELIGQKFIKEEDVRIIYAGKDSQYWIDMARKYELDSILVDKGIVTAKEVVDIQKNACINVLLSIASDLLYGVLTGKMIEYFEAGSPVLGIIVNTNDPELNSLLEELEIGESYSDNPGDHSAISQFIFNEYLEWKRTGMNRKPVNMHVLREKYSTEQTMKPLLDWMASHPSST